jgi:hypothetical protein
MNDTPPEVAARLNALFAQRSGDDRVRMACEMFDLARALMIGNIRAENPGIAGPELRVKIFERTYAEDFSPDDRARIITRLRG